MFLWEAPIAIWGFPPGAPIDVLLVDIVSFFKCFSDPHGEGDMFNVSSSNIHCYVRIGFRYPLCVARGSNATIGVALNTTCGCYRQCPYGQTDFMCMACDSRVVLLWARSIYTNGSSLKSCRSIAITSKLFSHVLPRSVVDLDCIQACCTIIIMCGVPSNITWHVSVCLFKAIQTMQR